MHGELFIEITLAFYLVRVYLLRAVLPHVLPCLDAGTLSKPPTAIALSFCIVLYDSVPALIMPPDMMLFYKHPISAVPGRWLLVMCCAVSFCGLFNGW